MKVTSSPVIGLMSGTSLDGLDMVCVEFTAEGDRLTHRVLAAETWSYDVAMQERLRDAHLSSGLELARLDVALGKLFGETVKEFIQRNEIQPAYIGSHGHTIFHQPEQGLTLQIGSPFHIAVACSTPVVAQFRNMDVALGGQGAPLVPIADQMIYSEYDACLNLGGIANISWAQRQNIAAYDICVCNMALNVLAQRKGKNYDEGGRWAASGAVNDALLKKLMSHPFYEQPGPKSLGKEFYEQHIEPHLQDATDHASTEDLLCTVTEYAAQCIGHVLQQSSTKNCLLTGGGALNTYLVERIQANSPCPITVGQEQDIHFKEAIAFALLAYLRMKGRTNVLKSVTGARCDHSAGVVFAPPVVKR
jgi:anhydro-N-acetylmuramic acid kinase